MKMGAVICMLLITNTTIMEKKHWVTLTAVVLYVFNMIHSLPVIQIALDQKTVKVIYFGFG